MKKHKPILKSKTILSIFLTLITVQLLAQKQNNTDKLSPLIKLTRSVNKHNKLKLLTKSNAEFELWSKSFLHRYTFKNIGDNIFEINNITQYELSLLIDNTNVVFIDIPNRHAKEERIMDNSDLSINNVSSVNTLFPNINGEGLTLSLKEGLLDTTDMDFHNKIVHLEKASNTLSFHATAMATLAAGSGNSDPKGKGVAWKSNISSTSFANLMPDDGEWLTNIGVSVQNHSYGTAIENYYGIESQKYDIVCNNYPNIIHVFSSGNSGSSESDHGKYSGIKGYANLTGMFKMSKNIITVGEINGKNQVKSISSKGPAYDGRIKPELVAFGDMGSSESAALVSGICILVQDAYKQNYLTMPEATLVKAALLNSANDIGRANIDFESGYGNANAIGAIKTILDNRFNNDNITQGEEKTFSILVPDNCSKLKVTIVWHDKESSPTQTENALVNDIDIELKQVSSNKKWLPWVLNSYPNIDSLILPAKRDVDHLNNIEQITIDNPEKGEYSIIIKGFKIAEPNQKYSIAWEFKNKGFEWMYPLQNSIIKANTNFRISWNYNGTETASLLQYYDFNSQTWKTIESQLDITKGFYEWETPKCSFKTKLKIVSNGEELISETFTISETTKIKTGLNCANEVMIHWNPIDEIKEYQVYQIDEKYLKEYKTTTDTAIFITGNDMQNKLYAVSPIIDNKKGLRSQSINYKTSGTNCYINSFYPISYITDTIQLKLNLSTDYKLNTYTLEGLLDGKYIPITKPQTIDNLEYTLTDNSPHEGRNSYRIKLERDDFEIIYSDDVDVFYSRIGSLIVYPNPVELGQEINIINGEDGSDEISIYTLSGKIVRQNITDFGSIKSIPTVGLKRGVYILEIKTEKGYQKTQKIIIQ